MIIVLMVPMTLIVGVYGSIRVAKERADRLEENQKNLALTMTAIQAASEAALQSHKLTDIQRVIIEFVGRQEAIDRIRLFDRDLAPTVVSTRVPVGDAVPEAAIRRVLQDGRPESLYARGAQPALVYVAPIRDPRGRTQAVLELVQLTTTIEDQVWAGHRDILIRLGLLLTSVAIVTAVVLQRQVLRPLDQLVNGIRALGAGRRTTPLATTRRDEFGQVAAAFNEMTESLEAARQQIAADTARTLDLEQQLRHAENLAVAGKLATGFAHEVGTPLNVISGRAEFLLDTLAQDDPRRTELSGIIRQIDRIAAIIHAMLDVVRPRKPQLRVLRLADVVAALLPLMEHAARRRSIQFSAVVPNDLPPIFADADQVQQVLLNLFINAFEATPPEGEVSMAASGAAYEGRSGVRIEVRDTGAGIPTELLDAVFKPFFTTKPRGQGTGLGLAICHDLVKDHGGELSVGSSPGKGATFVVWLPAPDSGLT